MQPPGGLVRAHMYKKEPRRNVRSSKQALIYSQQTIRSPTGGVVPRHCRSKSHRGEYSPLSPPPLSPFLSPHVYSG